MNTLADQTTTVWPFLYCSAPDLLAGFTKPLCDRKGKGSKENEKRRMKRKRKQTEREERNYKRSRQKNGCKRCLIWFISHCF